LTQPLPLTRSTRPVSRACPIAHFVTRAPVRGELCAKFLLGCLGGRNEASRSRPASPDAAPQRALRRGQSHRRTWTIWCPAVAIARGGGGARRALRTDWRSGTVAARGADQVESESGMRARRGDLRGASRIAARGTTPAPPTAMPTYAETAWRDAGCPDRRAATAACSTGALPAARCAADGVLATSSGRLPAPELGSSPSGTTSPGGGLAWPRRAITIGARDTACRAAASPLRAQRTGMQQRAPSPAPNVHDLPPRPQRGRRRGNGNSRAPIVQVLRCRCPRLRCPLRGRHRARPVLLLEASFRPPKPSQQKFCAYSPRTGHG